jgi:hypothetical protein
MQPLTVWLVAFWFIHAFVPTVSAQTAPVPGRSTGEPAGFLSRSAFFVSLAGMQTDDPRFSLVQRGRVDLDLFSHPRGRVNFLIDTELVMGTERRAFDLNHANVIFEASSSYRLGAIDVAAVVHHVSRHVVDREFDRVPAWFTVGARAGHLFPLQNSTIDVSLEYGHVVQHTFVDYTWTSQATIRLERTLRPAARAFASASGGLVGVDRAVLDRGRQAGARAEGGLHFTSKGGVVDLFAAYERRVDGYPTSRQPSSWLEFGFRFSAP